MADGRKRYPRTMGGHGVVSLALAWRIRLRRYLVALLVRTRSIIRSACCKMFIGSLQCLHELRPVVCYRALASLFAKGTGAFHDSRRLQGLSLVSIGRPPQCIEQSGRVYRTRHRSLLAVNVHKMTCFSYCQQSLVDVSNREGARGKRRVTAREHAHPSADRCRSALSPTRKFHICTMTSHDLTHTKMRSRMIWTSGNG